mmetsp:Transcript_24651/g.67061  ORF Transcript_24651/g.67061 Transcript_24651/m.67061 type:complete len:232 (+) Transcript_24651:39-734(+)
MIPSHIMGVIRGACQVSGGRRGPVLTKGSSTMHSVENTAPPCTVTDAMPTLTNRRARQCPLRGWNPPERDVVMAAVSDSLPTALDRTRLTPRPTAHTNTARSRRSLLVKLCKELRLDCCKFRVREHVLLLELAQLHKSHPLQGRVGAARRRGQAHAPGTAHGQLAPTPGLALGRTRTSTCGGALRVRPWGEGQRAGRSAAGSRRGLWRRVVLGRYGVPAFVCEGLAVCSPC